MERKVGDFATVAAAIYLTLENGSIRSAGIGLTSVGLTNLRAEAAESSLAGRHPARTCSRRPVGSRRRPPEPATDVRGSADYKRHVVDVFVRRALAAAAEMAGAA